MEISSSLMKKAFNGFERFLLSLVATFARLIGNIYSGKRYDHDYDLNKIRHTHRIYFCLFWVQLKSRY